MGLTRQRSRADGHFWYRSILISSAACCMASLLFQFVGFVTPGWIVLSAPTGITVNAGIWYIQMCSAVKRCHTATMIRVVNPFKIAGDYTGEFLNWVELQVEITLAFAACIVAIIMSVNSLVNMSRTPKVYLCWGCAGSVISAGLLLIPICRLLDIFHSWDSHTEYTPPYSLVSSLLGCVTIVASAVLDLCAICMIMKDLKTERVRDPSDERDDLTRNTL